MAVVKVSVVIPVYNTAPFVEEAINSIIKQTLDEIEIIVINDGSSDNSLQIISTLAQKDGRINVYTQENKGLSETRNRGLQLARGKYIYFMDSDDMLDEYALLECYEKCEADSLDFVFFDADIFGETVTTLNHDYHRTRLMEGAVQSGISRLEYFFNHRGYQPSACLNFINHSYLQRIKLRFYPKILHEDELFTFLLYANADRVGFLPKAYFKRRLRNNSIMVNAFSGKSMEGYMIVLNELLKFKKQRQDHRLNTVVDSRIKEILGGVLHNARNMKIRDRLRLLRYCLGEFRKYVPVKDLILLAFPVTRYSKKLSFSLTV